LRKPNILLINPSKWFYKKSVDQALNVKQLNFGILSIATKFPNNIFIYDCQNADHKTAYREISELIILKEISIVGISLISAYSEESAFNIANEIHNKFNKVEIIYGGKDHAPYIAKSLIEYHHAKAVIKYDGEFFFQQIIEYGFEIQDCPSIIYKDDTGKIVDNKEETSSTCLSIYDHTLYPSYLDYVPSIEVSRGCNKSCLFCTNNKTKQTTKKIEVVIQEINQIKTLYGEKICAYFQTPHFLFSNKDLIKLSNTRTKNDQFTWRTQTSVPYLTSKRIELLYNAGARVIDVGFESASPIILRRMGKTANSDEYLTTMRKALEVAAKVGLRLKLNILLFAGETQDSLAQTALFLEENLHNFHSFSAYPVMVYPGPNCDIFMAKIESEFGGSVVNISESDSIYSVNLSSTISHQKAKKIALLLGKAFQSREMYLSQRRIGYLQPNHSPDFNELNVEISPFYVSDFERLQARTELADIFKGVV